ncbi:MAG: molybdopterin-dependent oxidoreductase, partial [Rhodospirillales bacterium]|nr:molybdopterin-dependent oxidoreductase [Rhodospirillales bacterium]
LAADEIVAFARLYGRTQRSYIRVGYGFSRARNGAASVHAVTCLPTVTGAWRHRGGGALYTNSAIYPLDRTMIQGLDRRDPSIRALDQSRIGPILTGERRDLGDGPPVTALFIQNTNPMVVAPETVRVRDGFRRDDLFVCVHEQFMTDTAAMADIVLPATMFVEHDDIYTAGGHQYLQVTKKIVEPPGECQSNHEVLCALARRLGADHPGFGMSAWELIDDMLKTSGLPDAETMHAAHWHDCGLDFAATHFLNGFEHPDGKFRFKPDWRGMGEAGARMPVLPDQMAFDAPDTEHPFRLVAAPARSFLNSTFTETPGSRARENRPTVLIHPEDCQALGVIDGDRVRLGNRRASIVVHARPFDGLRRGVVVVESIWPNGDFEEGLGVNALVSADPGLPRGGAVFHDTAIWIRPAGPPPA